MMKSTKIRNFWLLFLAFLVIILLFLKVVPGGRIAYHYTWPRNLASGKGFLSDFKPAARLDVTEKNYLKIVADPVYFSLFTPRRFDSAIVTVKYRRELSSTTPIIELGVLKDKISGRYELRPLENRLLDNLRYSWHRLADTGAPLILQSENNYQNPSDFLSDWQANRLKNCPGEANSCVAVYNYVSESKYTIPNYRAMFPITINQPLRGAHQFYVYFTGGDWHINFNFVDLNQDLAQDPIEVVLLSGSTKIASQSIPDSNPNQANGQEESKSLVLQGNKLSAGVYKVEVKVSDDIIIKNIQSSAAKLVFINRIWPVSSITKPIKLWTNGSYLQAQTTNPASLSDISFGSGHLELTKAYQQFSSPAANDFAIREVKLTKDDIILDNNGVFSLAADNFFNPGVSKIDRYFKANEQIKYIVANYTEPASDRDFRIASASFDLSDANRENGKYTFLFSIPGLALADSQTATSAPAYLEIKEISVKLQGKTLWQKIFRRL